MAWITTTTTTSNDVKTTTYTTVELLTLQGSDYRRVSTAEPRQATLDEIPIIDVSRINGSAAEKRKLASQIKVAAEGSGLFYIKNHAVPSDVAEKALAQAEAFFAQPEDKKQLSSSFHSKTRCGWFAKGATQINKSETRGKWIALNMLLGSSS